MSILDEWALARVGLLLWWAQGSLCSHLIGREEVASDSERVTCLWDAFSSHVRLSSGPFDPYTCLLLVGHLYLESFLLVSCIFLGPNSPAHIFIPASVEFVNNSSCASIYSL